MQIAISIFWYPDTWHFYGTVCNLWIWSKKKNFHFCTHLSLSKTLLRVGINFGNFKQPHIFGKKEKKEKALQKKKQKVRFVQFHGTGQVNHNSFYLNIAIICIKCQIGWKDKNVSANLNLENDLPKFPHEKKIILTLFCIKYLFCVSVN